MPNRTEGDIQRISPIIGSVQSHHRQSWSGSNHRTKTPFSDEQKAPPSPESIMDAPHHPATFALPKSFVPTTPLPDDRLHEDTWSMVPGVLMSVVMVAATEFAQKIVPVDCTRLVAGRLVMTPCLCTKSCAKMSNAKN